MKLLKMFSVLSVLGFSALIHAECYVVVPVCITDRNVQLNQAFADNYLGAPVDANACLKRARDYLNYCIAPNAAAYFYTEGKPRLAVGVTLSTRTIYATDVSATRWSVLSPDL
jgi:hypothetical protein